VAANQIIGLGEYLLVSSDSMLRHAGAQQCMRGESIALEALVPIRVRCLQLAMWP